jgi:hypothetical protein
VTTYEESLEERAGELVYAETCYRPGCEYWVTGASDFCSEECEEEAAGLLTPAALARIGDTATTASERLKLMSAAALDAYEAYLSTVRNTRLKDR